MMYLHMLTSLMCLSQSNIELSIHSWDPGGPRVRAAGEGGGMGATASPMLIHLPQNGPVHSSVILPFRKLDAMIANNVDNPCFIHTSGHFILHMDHY